MKNQEKGFYEKELTNEVTTKKIGNVSKVLGKAIFYKVLVFVISVILVCFVLPMIIVSCTVNSGAQELTHALLTKNYVIVDSSENYKK